MKILKIVPIAELRDTKRMVELCEQVKEPIIITKNGYAELVVMNVDVFTEMAEELDALRQGAKG